VASTEEAAVTDGGASTAAAGYRFESAAAVEGLLRDVGYLPDGKIATVVHLGDRLGKPVLVEGPAGTGKTELAKAVAAMTGSRLIRLQCYEGMDEAKALYEWDYRKQLLAIQLHSGSQVNSAREGAGGAGQFRLDGSLFGEDFLLTRPLLEAIRATEPVVLLVDEVDRLDVEAEALLLEVLSDYQVSIPELGTVSARQVPLVFLTSNGSRELSEALKRRCLYLHIDYPTVDREREIVLSRVPGISAALATALAEVIRSLRSLDLKKKPSVSETLDWARTLLVLGAGQIDAELIAQSMPVLLKNQADIELAIRKLGDQVR
jgi:MoxR-like ATPase